MCSLTIMASLLFGGFLLNKDQVPSYCNWIAGASFFNYAYEALAVSACAVHWCQHVVKSAWLTCTSFKAAFMWCR